VGVLVFIIVFIVLFGSSRITYQSNSKNFQKIRRYTTNQLDLITFILVWKLTMLIDMCSEKLFLFIYYRGSHVTNRWPICKQAHVLGTQSPSTAEHGYPKW
jgi:hypothetical protein